MNEINGDDVSSDLDYGDELTREISYIDWTDPEVADILHELEIDLNNLE